MGIWQIKLEIIFFTHLYILIHIINFYIFKLSVVLFCLFQQNYIIDHQYLAGCSTICNQGLTKPFSDEHESYNKRLQPQPLQHHHQLPCYSRTNSILGSYSTPCSCAQKDSFSFQCDSCTIANRSDLYCTKLKEVENCHERIFEQESITNEETNDHKSPNNDLVCQGNSISGRESLISLSPINDLSPMGALDSLSSPRPTQALGLVDSKPESQSFSSSDNTETVFSNSITFQQG